MSKKSNPPATHAAVPATTAEHAHETEHDDLIVAPKGTSRVRFLLTLFLVLFVLVMFVVADLFQYVVGGSSRGGSNPDWMTWRDPVSGETEKVDALRFEETTRVLSQLTAMGLYRPDSAFYDLGRDRRRRNDPTDDDVASFLVYEDLAIDAGIEVSDEEHTELLANFFQNSENLRQIANRFQMQPRQLGEAIRRSRRVAKLKGLLEVGMSLGDPAAFLAGWQEQRPQYLFQYATLATADFAEAAAAAVPEDEALLEWWRTQPIQEQRNLFSPARHAVQVAWADLDGSFDATALLEAFPLAEGTDEETLASAYYERNKFVRFKNPNPTPAGEGDDGTTSDEAADQQQHQPFAEVREVALREAKIKAALDALRQDLLARSKAGETFDLAVEAAKYGLETYTAPEPVVTSELSATSPWGNMGVARQLEFLPVGDLMDVTVNDSRLLFGRVLERTEGAEQPIDLIRPKVTQKWIDQNKAKFAEERAEALVAEMAPRPEDLSEDLPHTPVVDETTFQNTLTAAGLTVQQYGWREQRGLKPGERTSDLAGASRFFFFSAGQEYFGLEVGEVAAPKRDMDGSNVYIVRLEGKRSKPAEELMPPDVQNMDRTAIDKVREVGGKIFLGDSDWFRERFQLRYPERERREAEKQAG
jgi:hypothetical protein